METPPKDYFKPYEPGRGVLVNGQHYIAKFGRSTLEMMVNDEAFSNNDYLEGEVEKLKAEATAQNERYDALKDENTGLNARIKQLFDQLNEHGITPYPPSDGAYPSSCEPPQLQDDGDKGVSHPTATSDRETGGFE